MLQKWLELFFFKVVEQQAAIADILGVVIRMSNPKCDWTNTYFLNLKNNDKRDLNT